MHAQDDKENCLDFYKSAFPVPVHLMGTSSGEVLRTRLSVSMAASNVCAKDFASNYNFFSGSIHETSPFVHLFKIIRRVLALL